MTLIFLHKPHKGQKWQEWVNALPSVPIANFSRNQISGSRRETSKLILSALQNILYKLETGRPTFFRLDGQIPLDMESAQQTPFITLQQDINMIEKAWASTQSLYHMLYVSIRRTKNKAQLGKMSATTIHIFQSRVFFSRTVPCPMHPLPHS